jgi:hypothetical protein
MARRAGDCPDDSACPQRARFSFHGFPEKSGATLSPRRRSWKSLRAEHDNFVRQWFLMRPPFLEWLGKLTDEEGVDLNASGVAGGQPLDLPVNRPESSPSIMELPSCANNQ